MDDIAENIEAIALEHKITYESVVDRYDVYRNNDTTIHRIYIEYSHVDDEMHEVLRDEVTRNNDRQTD